MSATEALATVGSPPASQPASPAPLSRSQILHATARCLREQGYDATTIRTIAGQLGCSVGSIYRYFVDKHDLMLAVTQEALEPIALAALAGRPLQDSIRDYHRLVAAGAESYRLMFWLACQQQAAAPGALSAAARLPDVIERIVTAWSTSLGDSRTARRVWSTLHGMILVGCSADECLSALAPLLSAARPTTPSRSASPTSDALQDDNSADRVAAPASVADVADHADPPPAAVGRGGDDVCLL